jgi:hypothetical protein
MPEFVQIETSEGLNWFPEKENYYNWFSYIVLRDFVRAKHLLLAFLLFSEVTYSVPKIHQFR